MRQLAGSAGIDVHRTQECLDGLRGLPHDDKTLSALLVQAAEARLMMLQDFERPQGVRNATQVSLGNGHTQPHIPMVRGLAEQRFARRQSLGEPLLS